MHLKFTSRVRQASQKKGRRADRNQSIYVVCMYTCYCGFYGKYRHNKGALFILKEQKSTQS